MDDLAITYVGKWPEWPVNLTGHKRPLTCDCVPPVPVIGQLSGFVDVDLSLPLVPLLLPASLLLLTSSDPQQVPPAL